MVIWKVQFYRNNLITISVMRFVGGKWSGFFGSGGGTVAVSTGGVIPVDAECILLLTWFIDVIMLWLLLVMAGDDAESTC